MVFNKNIMSIIVLLLLLCCFICSCAQPEDEAFFDSGLEVGAVSAAHPLAVEAGRKVLEGGGNAVDAAIAVSFALNVVEPQGSGLTGGGYMLILPAGESPAFINYRETAPAASQPDMFVDNEQAKIFSGLSVAVPGQLHGIEKAYNTYGSGNWDMAELIQPAIDLARDGFEAPRFFATLLGDRFALISKCEELSQIFLKDGFFPYAEGEIVKQENLADTLTLLAEEGFSAFYEGELAEKIVETVNNDGGILTLDDLRSYEVEMLTPLEGSFGDYTLYTTPLPSSGGIVLLQLLEFWNNYPYETEVLPDAGEIAYLAEAMRIAFDGCDEHMGDHNFVDVPVEMLLSKEYISQHASSILDSTPDNQESREEESSSTTAFVTADSDGNLVVVAQTINHNFGAMFGVPGTGIILNNQMNSFSSNPDSPNAPEGGKRPLSNMVPTIFLKEGKPVLAITSPAARRLTTAIFQVSINYLKRGYSLEEAVDAPRFHYQGARLEIEPGFSEQILSELENQGFVLNEHADRNYFFGGVAILAWEKEGPAAYFDPRRDGTGFAR